MHPDAAAAADAARDAVVVRTSGVAGAAVAAAVDMHVDQS